MRVLSTRQSIDLALRNHWRAPLKKTNLKCPNRSASRRMLTERMLPERLRRKCAASAKERLKSARRTL
jgi:hypothetical protein